MNPSKPDPQRLLAPTPLSRRRMLGGMLGGAAALTLAAGRGEGVFASPRPTGSTPTSSPGDWEAEWEALIEAAQAEGELVCMFGATTAAAEGAIREQFTKQFDIKLELVPGGTTEVVNRVLAERGQGIYSVDIASMGASAMTRLLDADTLTPLMPQLLIPDTIDRSTNWRVDYIPWAQADTEAQFVTYYSVVASRNIMRIYYNTDNVTSEQVDAITSWQDFLTPEWRGRLAIQDLVAGSHLQRNQLWHRLGRDYLDELFRNQDVTVWAQDSDVNFANAIINGDQDICLAPGGAEGAFLDAVDQGLPLAEWPNVLEEGPAVDYDSLVSVVDQPAHPNAAKLYVNWILSKAGGEAFNGFTNRPLAHLRSDAPQGALDDETWKLVQSADFGTVLNPNTDEYRQIAEESLEFWTNIYDELGINPAQ